MLRVRVGCRNIGVFASGWRGRECGAKGHALFRLGSTRLCPSEQYGTIRVHSGRERLSISPGKIALLPSRKGGRYAL